MVVEEPVTELALASALQLPPPQVTSLLAELRDDYDASGRGFELREVAGGWRMFSRADYAPVVERFVLDGQQARLTQAALETLAVVAYRQPVSRARVSAVRGVNVDGVMRTLVTRGLVEERGTDGESGAILYGTTSYFLERIGVTSLDQLPELAPFVPDMDDSDLEEALATMASPERVDLPESSSAAEASVEGDGDR
jgi:segregation and condensation protein B